MRAPVFATLSLAGLGVLACAWIGTGARPGAALPAVDAAPPEIARPAPDNTASVLEVLAFLRERHSGLADAELEGVAHAIVEEARRHDLDPHLVLAVIRVESAGYNFAVSHVGAYGLMQVMPATGREMAERLEIDWHGPHTLFDPIANVRIGTAYLRILADRYDGDVPTALAAYNWGPGRIDGFLRRGRNVPGAYIRQVMEAHADTVDALRVTRS